MIPTVLFLLQFTKDRRYKNDKIIPTGTYSLCILGHRIFSSLEADDAQ